MKSDDTVVIDKLCVYIRVDASPISYHTIVIKISLKRKEFYVQNSSIETFEMKFLLFNTPNTTVRFVL